MPAKPKYLYFNCTSINTIYHLCIYIFFAPTRRRNGLPSSQTKFFPIYNRLWLVSDIRNKISHFSWLHHHLTMAKYQWSNVEIKINFYFSYYCKWGSSASFFFYLSLFVDCERHCWWCCWAPAQWLCMDGRTAIHTGVKTEGRTTRKPNA